MEEIDNLDNLDLDNSNLNNIDSDNPNSPRKRGRPPGSKNRSAKFTRYNPKRWHPEFDLIIMESINGSDNETIGNKYGYTKEHISNILSTPQAAEIKERIRGAIDKEFEGNVKERIAKMGATALRHVENFIKDEDNLASRKPFEFVDRALKIAQSASTLVPDSNSSSSRGNTTIVNGNAMIINNESANNLALALERSQELDKVKVGDIIDIPKQENPRLLLK